MILRRLYSSAPSHRASAALAQIHPAAATATAAAPAGGASAGASRGRTKPRFGWVKPVKSRHATTLAKPVQAVSLFGRGRKPRAFSHRASVQSSAIAATTSSSNTGASYPSVPEPSTAPGIPRTPKLSFTHAVPAVNHVHGFDPIYLYPEQFKLHMTFRQPGRPMPLFLGTGIYKAPLALESGVEDIFAKPATKTTPKMDGGALGEHLDVLRSLPWPATASEMNEEALGEMESGVPEMEFSSIYDLLENRATALTNTNTKEWENVVDILQGKADCAQVQDKGKEVEKMDADMGAVVSDLTSLLHDMELADAQEGLTDGAGDGVYMDSVKRKRRKKISKHKYKKRRKATKALRKRLGK